MIMAMLMVYEDFSVIWEKHFLISADKLIDLWGYFMTCLLYTSDAADEQYIV